MELTWSHDYCLACDKQTSGGAYCSQSCRLADLESSTAWSTPQTSPSTTTFPATSSTTSRPCFYLSPAIDWSSYKKQPTTTQPPYFSNTTSSQSKTTDKVLTPSTSHSSLTSKSSTKSQNSPFSQEVTTQLRNYANSFDTTRHRRKTWS